LPQIDKMGRKLKIYKNEPSIFPYEMYQILDRVKCKVIANGGLQALFLPDHPPDHVIPPSDFGYQHSDFALDVVVF
jgi:hypothetical protein